MNRATSFNHFDFPNNSSASLDFNNITGTAPFRIPQTGGINTGGSKELTPPTAPVLPKGTFSPIPRTIIQSAMPVEFITPLPLVTPVVVPEVNGTPVNQGGAGGGGAAPAPDASTTDTNSVKAVTVNSDKLKIGGVAAIGGVAGWMYASNANKDTLMYAAIGAIVLGLGAFYYFKEQENPSAPATSTPATAPAPVVAPATPSNFSANVNKGHIFETVKVGDTVGGETYCSDGLFHKTGQCPK